MKPQFLYVLFNNSAKNPSTVEIDVFGINGTCQSSIKITKAEAINLAKRILEEVEKIKE